MRRSVSLWLRIERHGVRSNETKIEKDLPSSSKRRRTFSPDEDVRQ